MSASVSAGLNATSEVNRTIEQDEFCVEVRTFRASRAWNPETFAREQIRGLVQQVFFSNTAPTVRQVVFSPVDTETDVRRICRRVGEALALETTRSVVLAGNYPQMYEHAVQSEDKGVMGIRQATTRLRGNLWLVPLDRGGDESFSAISLHAHLSELRRAFEYSIVEGEPAGGSNEATAMAQLTDGIVLVLSAHRTRRATARSIKERLEAARARILGVVLSDRVFPIPEAIYQRL